MQYINQIPHFLQPRQKNTPNGKTSLFFAMDITVRHLRLGILGVLVQITVFIEGTLV